MKPSILAFAEDAGAANYIAPLVPALTAAGWPVRLMTSGVARAYIARHGVMAEPLPRDRDVASLLDQQHPQMLLVGTSENLDSPSHTLVDAARTRGVPAIGAVDSASNATLRFGGRSADPLSHAPDWLIVPDEYTRHRYIELGFDRDRVIDCGHPIYDSVAAASVELAGEGQYAVRRRAFPAEAHNRTVFVFLSELSDGLDRTQFQRLPEYSLHGRGTANGRTEIVLEEILDAVRLLEPRPYLVLRLHPKENRSVLRAYADEFDFVSEGGSPLEIAYAANLVIGMTTSLLLEAAILGKPTLAVLPRATEAQWLATTRTGVTPAVTNRAALAAALAAAVRGNPVQGAALEQAIRLGAPSRFLTVIERIVANGLVLHD